MTSTGRNIQAIGRYIKILLSPSFSEKKRINASIASSFNDWQNEIWCNSLLKRDLGHQWDVWTFRVRDCWMSTQRANKQVKFFDRVYQSIAPPPHSLSPFLYSSLDIFDQARIRVFARQEEVSSSRNFFRRKRLFYSAPGISAFLLARRTLSVNVWCLDVT